MEGTQDYEALARTLVEDFYKRQNTGLLGNLSKKNYEELSVSRERIKEDLRNQLSSYVDGNGNEMSEEDKDIVLELIRQEMWGYGIIDSLIHDPDISDIKTYSWDSIRVKIKGEREDAGIKFQDNAAYSVFVTRLLERNKINLGTANAIQTFTDTTQDGFILRITAISGLLTDNALPVVAFRKIPKNKYRLGDLEKAGMFNHINPSNQEKIGSDEEVNLSYLSKENETIDAILVRMISSRGILFTGKGASGKTTLMNAMLAEIPTTDSIMICQENSELFDNNHPDLLAAHVLVNGGDSKVSYNLGDLTRAALLVDLDRVIVGEVKEGSEAAGLFSEWCGIVPVCIGCR